MSVMAKRTWSVTLDWNDVPVVLNVGGLCALLQISEKKALELLNAGEIVAVKSGKAWKIDKAAVRDYLRRAGGADGGGSAEAETPEVLTLLKELLEEVRALRRFVDAAKKGKETI